MTGRKIPTMNGRCISYPNPACHATFSGFAKQNQKRPTKGLKTRTSSNTNILTPCMFSIGKLDLFPSWGSFGAEVIKFKWWSLWLKANPRLAWKNTYDREMPALGNSGSQWIFLEIYLTVLKTRYLAMKSGNLMLNATNNMVGLRWAKKN